MTVKRMSDYTEALNAKATALVAKALLDFGWYWSGTRMVKTSQQTEEIIQEIDNYLKRDDVRPMTEGLGIPF